MKYGMQIFDLINLYVGYNELEDFTVLIKAEDAQEAQRCIVNYALDSGFDFDNILYWHVRPVTAKDVDTQFDCDRIISLEEVLEDYKREKESFKKCEGGRIEV
jgi:hypothetical protein